MTKSMTRLWSGALIAIIGFGAIYLLDNEVIAVVTGVLCLVVAYEWSRLNERHSDVGDVPNVRRIVQIVLTAIMLLLLFARPDILPWWLLATGVWWLFLFVHTVSYTSANANDNAKKKWRRFLFRLGLPLVVPATWAAFVHLHAMNKWWLLYVIALVSLSDVGAYYTGRKFGKKRMCPDLSPGKTRAGLWGGVAAALALCFVVLPFIEWTWQGNIHLVLISLCAVQIGVIGDLTISLLKRDAGAKDTGSVLPGHGGILDRVDSLLPALPLFFVALQGWYLGGGI